MNLKLCGIEENYHLVWPDNCRDFAAESPALAVVTDFRFTMPRVIESDTPAYDLEELMTKAHERFKLVVDADNRFLVSASDIAKRLLTDTWLTDWPSFAQLHRSLHA